MVFVKSSTAAINIQNTVSILHSKWLASRIVTKVNNCYFDKIPRMFVASISDKIPTIDTVIISYL